jgi:hypothetical protein
MNSVALRMRQEPVKVSRERSSQICTTKEESQDARLATYTRHPNTYFKRG